jgi:hypothetical protein
VIVPVDVDMMARGFFRSWDCRVSQVPQLDAIARDTPAHGVTVLWGLPGTGEAGEPWPFVRVIVLAPWLLRLLAVLDSGCVVTRAGSLCGWGELRGSAPVAGTGAWGDKALLAGGSS